jgi:hypothetical protein
VLRIRVDKIGMEEEGKEGSPCHHHVEERQILISKMDGIVILGHAVDYLAFLFIHIKNAGDQ